MDSKDIALLLPWEEIEGDAIKQIMHVASLPIVKRMAIMPDCHTGYDMPIGGVALVDGAVNPAYVGYDIGCGMTLSMTGLRAEDLNERKKKQLFKDIYEVVPTGLGAAHSTTQDPQGLIPEVFESASNDKNLNDAVNAKLLPQFGTLGSGNHFIELGQTTRVNPGEVAVTIHSGSRNVGHTIATYYMKLAEKAQHEGCRGFFGIETELGRQYLKDMEFALNYALANRLRMVHRVLDILGSRAIVVQINENHNHAVTTVDGVLHRKGATPADKGQYGVIPGNMRDGVFVTRGLGNDTYLSSASHGAGRKMSRAKAKASIPLEKFEKSMHGIVARVDKGTLDEAPFAYKHLQTVIDRQEGIVIDVMDHITPLINVKG